MRTKLETSPRSKPPTSVPVMHPVAMVITKVELLRRTAKLRSRLAFHVNLSTGCG